MKVLQSDFRSLHTVSINMCGVKALTWLHFIPNLKELQILGTGNWKSIYQNLPFTAPLLLNQAALHSILEDLDDNN